MGITASYFIIRILPVLMYVSFTIYLAYVLGDTDRKEKIMRKQMQKNKNKHIFEKIYTKDFLISSIGLSLFFMILIGIDIYESQNALSSGFATIALVVLLILISLPSFLRIFNKRDKH